MHRQDSTITGVIGRLVWAAESWVGAATAKAQAYYTAADVVAWTVTRFRDDSWAIVATIVHENAYKLAQRPLLFVAPTTIGDWRWPLLALDVRDHVVRARLGMPLQGQRQEGYGEQSVYHAEDRAAAYLRQRLDGRLDRREGGTELWRADGSLRLDARLG